MPPITAFHGETARITQCGLRNPKTSSLASTFGRGGSLCPFFGDLAPGQSITEIVHVSEAGDDTTVSALSEADGAWHDVVVFDGVTGVDVAALYSAGDLII
jgi:hypothetical protein